MEIVYKTDGIELDGLYLSLEEIKEKCNNAKIEEDDLVILEISKWLDSRGFDGVTESKVYPRKTAYQIKELLLDREIYFGEIAGKHSEVYGTMEDDDFEIIEDKNQVKELLKSHNGWDYNHSFLETFFETLEEEQYTDITEEEKELFFELY